jgi:hypothetical protein
VTEGRCNFGEGAVDFQVGVLAEFSSRILTASVMEDRCKSGEGVGSYLIDTKLLHHKPCLFLHSL